MSDSNDILGIEVTDSSLYRSTMDVNKSLTAMQSHSSARDILEASKAWMVSDQMRGAREALMSFQTHSSARDILKASKAWMISDEVRGAREALMSVQAHSSARDILEASKAWM
ncbi:hypothetical protein, partial [Cellvibrio fibrivorans]